MLLLRHAACAYIAAIIVAFGRAADFHTFVGAGVDKGEGVVDGIIVHHNTYVTYTASGARTGEEHQVATLHLPALDGDVACILVARRTADVDIVLSKHIAGETRAVEGVRAFASAAIACADESCGLIHDAV